MYFGLTKRFGIHENKGRYYFHEYLRPEDYIDLQVYDREDDLHWQRLMIKFEVI